MNESRPGRYRLLRVRAQDEGTLALLARLGLVPGARFELIACGPEGARVELAEGRFLLPPELAAALEVEEAS